MMILLPSLLANSQQVMANSEEFRVKGTGNACTVAPIHSRTWYSYRAQGGRQRGSPWHTSAALACFRLGLLIAHDDYSLP